MQKAGAVGRVEPQSGEFFIQGGNGKLDQLPVVSNLRERGETIFFAVIVLPCAPVELAGEVQFRLRCYHGG